jgi:KUP system potassium uptake protein
VEGGRGTGDGHSAGGHGRRFAAPAGGQSNGGWGHLLFLSLAALGIVFGDIGTSPLYALRVCFGPDYTVETTPQNVLGTLSLVFWALILIISVKYLVFILRADNHGEGGILALMALARPALAGSAHRRGKILVTLGLFGAALLYGDGIITPAISVLSAVEGLEVTHLHLTPLVIPITVALLVGLFLLQRRGTTGVGVLFGPVMLIWFITLALLGIRGLWLEPSALAAVNPYHALSFFVDNRVHGFLMLGAIFLAVTGGEALYADMGHFGRGPIRFTWFSLVLPSLLLNYFGQGALLIRDPSAERNPFFLLAPTWAALPLVFLATIATIIASQAVISGSFSLTRQAVQLGFSPRLLIRHTSSEEIGQIYVPAINWALMLATIALVLGFRSSQNLAAAYGVAVTTTMVITTLLFYVVAHEQWGWRPWVAGPAAAGFLVVDLSFFGANIIKVEHGGWFPLLVAVFVYTIMATWKRGRSILARRLIEDSLPMELFLEDLKRRPPLRVPGTAVFMTGSPEGVPPALLHNLKHNQILHERVALVTVVTEEIPHVPPKQRLTVTELGCGIYRLVGHYGFMETPNIPKLLAAAAQAKGLQFEIMKTTFFLGRETLVPSGRPEMALWREHLFAFMSRNAQRATTYFDIPVNRVVEIGTQIEF